MAKTMGTRDAGASVLVLLGSIAYLWVVWSAWKWGNSVFFGTSNVLILTTVAWSVIFGVAATASLGLLFMSLASLMGGWMSEMQEGAKMAVRVAGVTLFTWSFVGGLYWLILTTIGFILVWIGIAKTMM